MRKKKREKSGTIFQILGGLLLCGCPEFARLSPRLAHHSADCHCPRRALGLMFLIPCSSSNIRRFTTPLANPRGFELSPWTLGPEMVTPQQILIAFHINWSLKSSPSCTCKSTMLIWKYARLYGFENMLVFRDYDPNIGLYGLSKFPIPKLDAPSSLKSFSTSFDSHHLQFLSKIDQSSFGFGSSSN